MRDNGFKRGIFIISMAVAAMLLFVSVGNIPQSTLASAKVAAEEELFQVKASRSVYEDEYLFADIYYNDLKLPYSRYNKTLYLTVYEGMDLRPENFHVIQTADTEGFQVLFETFPDEETLEESISDGKEYPIILYNESYYIECSLVFTSMPVLDISFTEDEDGEYRIVEGILQSGSFDNGEILEFEAKMRARGGISLNYPKLGFKLKLIEQDAKKNRIKREESLLGMRKSDSWNLSALYADDTKIRDKAAIDLWAEMSEDGIPFDATFGTRMEYVEVVMKGQYMGLYGIMEPIDEEQLGITDKGHNGLYEYYYKKEGEELADDSVLAFASGDVRIPTKEENQEDMILSGLELKNGEGQSARTVWSPIRQYMSMLREGTYSEAAPKLLDIENVADVWIYIQTVQGVDNRAKNLYYCAKVVDGEYKIYFIPWDMDMTWGNETDLNEPTLQSYYTYPVDKIMNWTPGTQLIEENVGGIREIIEERWKKLRQGPLSEEALIGSMEEQYAYLTSSGAYARNKERWEESPHADDLTQITAYATERLKVLDEYILGGFR